MSREEMNVKSSFFLAESEKVINFALAKVSGAAP